MIGTCGHLIPEKWFASDKSTYTVKYVSREGKKTYAQICTCEKCRRDNAKHKLILTTPKQIKAWLNNKNPSAVAY